MSNAEVPENYVGTQWVEHETKKPKRILIVVTEEENVVTDEVEEKIQVSFSDNILSPLDVCRYLANVINDTCVSTQATAKTIQESEERENEKRKLQYAKYVI